MKPAIDTNKHGDPGSSSSQPSQAGHGLARLRKALKRERRRERENVRFIDGWEQYKVLVVLATVVLMLVMGSGVVRSSTGIFNALISLR